MQAAVWADAFFPRRSLFKTGKRELEACYRLGSAPRPLLLVSQLLARDGQRQNARTGQCAELEPWFVTLVSSDCTLKT